MTEKNNDEKVVLDILGYVHCAAKDYRDVPSEGLQATLILHQWLEPALEGLSPGDFIYVIVLFHKSDPTILKASPNTKHQRGAFALRSSDRPNRIGMTLTQIERIEGSVISISWIDFSDGTPILDIKRYSNCWECVFSAPGDDRRFIERQIPMEVLATVLARPIRNFAGNAPETGFLASAAAELVQVHNIFLHDPSLRIHIRGTGSLSDAVQGLTKASFGNKRLTVEYESDRSFGGQVEFRQGEKKWLVEINLEGYFLSSLIQ